MKTSGERRFPSRRSCLLLLALAGVLAVVLVGAAAFLFMRAYAWPEDGTRLAGGAVELVSDGFIAAYLVELADGGVALVDATMDPGAQAIRRGLRRNGRTPGDVRAILLTHGHGDHIAGARSFPRAAVYALAPDVDLVEGRRVAQSPFARSREPHDTGIRVTRALRDGERLTVGGTAVEVFALPGHTLGSAAYLIHGVLFLGDSAASQGNGAISAAPPVFSADRDLARRSLRALAERLEPRRGDVVALAFGHQAPLQGEGIEPLLEWARRSD